MFVRWWRVGRSAPREGGAGAAFSCVFTSLVPAAEIAFQKQPRCAPFRFTPLLWRWGGARQSAPSQCWGWGGRGIARSGRGYGQKNWGRHKPAHHRYGTLSRHRVTDGRLGCNGDTWTSLKCPLQQRSCFGGTLALADAAKPVSATQCRACRTTALQIDTANGREASALSFQ